jgi:hypothetical protein
MHGNDGGGGSGNGGRLLQHNIVARLHEGKSALRGRQSGVNHPDDYRRSEVLLVVLTETMHHGKPARIL